MPWREVRGDGPWRRWALVVLAAGLAVTVAGVAVTWRLYRDSEERLLDQQAREAGAVLTAAIARVETALGNAAVFAEATNGEPARFTSFADALAEDAGFTGLELVGADGGQIAAGGEAGLDGPDEHPEAIRDLIGRARADRGTVHIELLIGQHRRIGYAIAAPDGGDLVVYAESPLPDRPTGLQRSDGPFSDIDYGVYIGSGESSGTLLYTSTQHVPLEGPKSVITLPFGDQGLTFAAAPATSLTGRFSQLAPWILGIGGALVSVVAALGTRSVIRRGRAAEQLAGRLAQVSAQQRAGIDTLRRSLLPRRLAAPPGVSIGTGYWPADSDHEISGDFYDAFQVGPRRWAIVIGDVCGKGTEAAALTGLTRHTIRAAARHLSFPADVLRWTHEAIAAYGAATYVTACFAFLDIADDGTVSVDLALGGHPRPALWHDGAVASIGSPGTILGLVAPKLTSERRTLSVGDVLVLYTDGLTDAPRTSLDEDALNDVVADAVGAAPPDAIAEVLHREVERRRPDGNSDDSAVLVIRITGPTAGSAAAGSTGGLVSATR